MNVTRRQWIIGRAICALMVVLGSWGVPLAQAQMDTIPTVNYYVVFGAYQAGDFATAIKGFERAGRTASRKHRRADQFPHRRRGLHRVS